MDSRLNPEASEFFPSTMIKRGYESVNKAVRSSKHMPTGASYDLFETYTDFNIVTSQLIDNIILYSNQVIRTELPAVKLKCNDNEFNTEKVIDANDNILDRVNINIDSESGVNQSGNKFLEVIEKVNVASWNKQPTPVIIRLQEGNKECIGARNILRPQMTFKDPIDNSHNLWVPKIKEKPNNIKPLALKLLYNDNGDPVGYEHPYQAELDFYEPPKDFIHPDAEAPLVPPPMEDTSLTFVATEDEFNQLLSHLDEVNAIAIDVEHNSFRTYQGITCLIQMTTEEGGDFIIDALALREHLHKLNNAFTDRKKVKVFHGADNDVLWLQRDFGVYVVGLFDTFQAARVLGFTAQSLKYLLKLYCDFNAEKHYQLADWRIRPLPTDLIKYARSDTHYLLYVWRCMKAELLKKGSGQPTFLLSAFELSRQTCGKTYTKRVVDDNSYMELYLRRGKSFSTQQMAALQLLYKWRDTQAREQDESTSYLLPDSMLLALAETLPREIQGINACCDPLPPLVKQNTVDIHRIILSCRELPSEPQLYQMPSAIRTMVNPRHYSVAYNVHDFSQYPRSNLHINLDQAMSSLTNFKPSQPEIQAFMPMQNWKHSRHNVSDLNADSKNFMSPYERYLRYRTLAQLEEMKTYKNKEAKIAALGKGNELIQREVLTRLQDANSRIAPAEDGDKADKEKTKKLEGGNRKRKVSNDKEERNKVGTQNVAKDEDNSESTEKSSGNKNPKAFSYKNANYKKFYDSDSHNQPKRKFKEPK